MANLIPRVLSRLEDDPPPDLAQAFDKLARQQRNKPESMFSREYNPGSDHSNMWQWAMEHTGDLIHRAAQTHGWGRGAVEEKVEKLLRAARSGYGFSRELLEQLHSNWEYRVEHGRYDKPKETFIKEAFDAGERYAKAYEVLKPITKFQRLGKEAAIALGRRKWEEYRQILTEFKSLIDQGKLETDYYIPENHAFIS